MTSSTSTQSDTEQLPVILEPPWLTSVQAHHSGTFYRNRQPFPDSRRTTDGWKEQPDSWKVDEIETETGTTQPIVEIRMADEGFVFRSVYFAG